MMKKLWSFAANVCFVAIVANWLIRGSDMAHNFSVFLIWVYGVLGLFIWGIVSSGKPPRPVKRKPVMSAIHGALDVLALCLLVGYGQFLLAAVYLFYLTGAAVLLSMENDEFVKQSEVAA